jgi:imidazole glycerol-phosphate synthase subunit HisF
MRLISRLDVKAPNLVKGINYEGLRKLGDPADFAIDYFDQGADELIFIDIVASLYGRNSLLKIIEKTSKGVFIPITVGGGIRTLEDFKKILRSGADKVAINTAAILDPSIINKASDRYGSQCVVLSIEAKQVSESKWEAYFDSGREKSGRDILDWAKEIEQRGGGEILINSVDRDGTPLGPDFSLIEAINRSINIPVIASGGIRTSNHIKQLYDLGIEAVALGSALHYKKTTCVVLKNELEKLGVPLRRLANE